MKYEIRQYLLSLGEKEYQTFSSSLLPGVDNIIGIRLPELRKLAKKIAKENWKEAIFEQDIYFEEIMLHGMILSYVPLSLEELLPYIRDFIPLVNNWSVCDSVFSKMTVFQTDREQTLAFITPYLASDREFEIRIALMILMQHFLKCDQNGEKISRQKKISLPMLSDNSEKDGRYLKRIFSELNQVNTERYYASMMAAWLLAESFCCFPYHTVCFMKENSLDPITWNRAIQKMTESNTPDADVKQFLRDWKKTKNK